MQSLTVEQVVDRAKLRHWAVGAAGFPDGAVVAFLDDLQRSVLLRTIMATEALLGQTEQIDTTGTQRLIALDDNGEGYFATTAETGYALKLADGVPYIDVDTPFVVDPFGEDGDIPGLPLPTDLLRLIGVSATLTTQTSTPLRPQEVQVIEERNAIADAGSMSLRAFISAGRLVPVRTNENDRWSLVSSVRLSLVRCPQLTTMTDLITLPLPCIAVLVAAVAEMLATASKECPETDKRRLERQRAEAEQLLDMSAENILDAVTSSSVIFRR